MTFFLKFREDEHVMFILQQNNLPDSVQLIRLLKSDLEHGLK